MKVVNLNVLVSDESPPERTASGLFMAGTTDAALVIRGKVVAVAEEVAIAGVVSVGDIVHFNRHSTFPVTLSGVKFRVLPAKEILVIE